MTNADVIRKMTDKQLFDFLSEWECGDIDYSITFCDLCEQGKRDGGQGNVLGLDCDGCREHWLKRDAVDYGGLLLEIQMAIESLPTIEVSEDCISRAGALKAYNEAVDELVKAEMKEFNLGDFTECSFNTTQLKLIARKIEDAPSVVPSRAEGEWLLDGRCSNCLQAPLTTHKTYCPNCGAKMHLE